MIQHPLAVDPTLRQLVEAIVSGTRPKRVILFGSRARGDAADDSDYDFVVELDTKLDRRAATSMVKDSIGLVDASVDILVRAPGELEQHGDDPGLMTPMRSRQRGRKFPPHAMVSGNTASRYQLDSGSSERRAT